MGAPFKPVVGLSGNKAFAPVTFHLNCRAKQAGFNI